MQRSTAVVFVALVSLFLLFPELHVQAVSGTKCPKDCHKHGRCETINGTDICRCGNDWGGYSCGYSNYNLTNDDALSVTIAKNMYIYFTLAVNGPPAKYLEFLVWGYSKKPGVKGPAFYLGYNYYPNSSHYDIVDNSTVLKKNYTIHYPKRGKWYLAVLGQDSDRLILTVQANLGNNISSNNGCSAEEQFQHKNKCVCARDISPYCDVHAKPLEYGGRNGGVLSEDNSWNYWYMNIGSATSINGNKPRPFNFMAVSISVEENRPVPELEFLNSISAESLNHTTTVVKVISFDELRENILYIGVCSGRDNIIGPYTIKGWAY